MMHEIHIDNIINMLTLAYVFYDTYLRKFLLMSILPIFISMLGLVLIHNLPSLYNKLIELYKRGGSNAVAKELGKEGTEFYFTTAPLGGSGKGPKDSLFIKIAKVVGGILVTVIVVHLVNEKIKGRSDDHDLSEDIDQIQKRFHEMDKGQQKLADKMDKTQQEVADKIEDMKGSVNEGTQKTNDCIKLATELAENTKKSCERTEFFIGRQMEILKSVCRSNEGVKVELGKVVSSNRQLSVDVVETGQSMLSTQEFTEAHEQLQTKEDFDRAQEHVLSKDGFKKALDQFQTKEDAAKNHKALTAFYTKQNQIFRAAIRKQIAESLEPVNYNPDSNSNSSLQTRQRQQLLPPNLPGAHFTYNFPMQLQKQINENSLRISPPPDTGGQHNIDEDTDETVIEQENRK